MRPATGTARCLQRPFTESTQRRRTAAIVRLTGKRFENFTLQPTAGYYKGKVEKSIVIEIAGAAERDVKNLAVEVQKMNGQKSVLVTRMRGVVTVTRLRRS